MTDAIDCAFTVQGEGPPLFLIHGIGAARNTWAKALPVLTPHYTVITYDLRGHGASPMPDGEFGLDELVNDLERVREQTGFETAHFAGHSLGGMIGPAYARRYPNRVLSLGLLQRHPASRDIPQPHGWSGRMADPPYHQCRASGSHSPGSDWHRRQNSRHQPNPHRCNAVAPFQTGGGTNRSPGNAHAGSSKM